MNNRALKILYLLFGWSLIFAHWATADNYSDKPRDGVEFYLKTYGQVKPEALEDVYAVFNKVLAVADKNNLYWPQLVVINDTRQASAFVLSDGNIFLSRRALDLIREDADVETFEARLAFILGHELAHLANNDFWDEQISQALMKFSTGENLPSILNTSDGQIKKELKADDQGFLFAALAGFQVERLLETNAEQDSFFRFWLQKVGVSEDDSHPDPRQRADMLRSRLAEKLQVVDAYEYGVRLIHFGRYREAITLLRAFQKHYPGRELFNSLGYAHLKQALQILPPSYVNFYWLPTVSDMQTRLSGLGYRTGQESGSGMGNNVAYSPETRENLVQAIQYFQLAIDKDNQYLTAYVNLATAQFLLERAAPAAGLRMPGPTRFSQTVATIETGLHRHPDAIGLLLIKLIVMHELGESELLDQALNAIEGIQMNSLSVQYNLARAATDTSQSEGYWVRVMNGLEALPYPIQQQLCQEKQNELLAVYSRENYQAICINRTFPRFTQTNFPWDLPLALSRDLLEYPLTENEQEQGQWRQKDIDEARVLENNLASMLAIDDITTLLVLKSPALGDAGKLVDCCGYPRVREELSIGTLWHYGPWATVIKDEEIQEVWVNSY